MASGRNGEFDAIFAGCAGGLAWGESKTGDGDVRVPTSCAPLVNSLLVLVAGAGPPRPKKAPAVVWGFFEKNIIMNRIVASAYLYTA